MLRLLSAVFLATVAVSGRSQGTAPALAGTLEAGVYASPTNAFKIAVPVLPELGGMVRDTEQVVFFQDSFGIQISIGAFKQDATQRWEMETRDAKEYTIYYFGRLVMPEFKRYCPNRSEEHTSELQSLVCRLLLEK